MKIVLAALFAAFLTPGSARACANLTAAQPGTQPYDAASPVQASMAFQVTFADVCPEVAGARTVQMWFADDVDPGSARMVGGVPFSIREGGVSYLFGPGEAVSQPFNFTFAQDSVSRSFDFVLLPGYDATAATRQIRMRWTTTDANGAPIEGEQILTVGLTIVPIFSLRLSAGGSAGTLDFGALQAGARLSALLDVRASSAFTITAASQYGALRRASPCGQPLGPAGDEADLVRYSASLNGRGIDLVTPYTDSDGNGSSVRSINGLPIDVDIDPSLDPKTKRAGAYCDVLTLTIAPRN